MQKEWAQVSGVSRTMLRRKEQGIVFFSGPHAIKALYIRHLGVLKYLLGLGAGHVFYKLSYSYPSTDPLLSNLVKQDRSQSYLLLL